MEFLKHPEGGGGVVHDQITWIWNNIMWVISYDERFTCIGRKWNIFCYTNEYIELPGVPVIKNDKMNK